VTKPTEKQHKEIRRYVKKYRSRLYLEEWVFNTNFAVEDNNNGAWASSTPDTIYLQCEIMIYPSFWKKKRNEREEIICHELCHCITQELYEASYDLHCGKHITTKHLNDMRERLTQRLTNAVFEW